MSGLASLFIPGLGQMISNEGGRGADFLAGDAGCCVLYGVGVEPAVNDIATDGYSDGSGAGLMVIGASGALVIGIWSIVDAVHVAKVNNMAWRDRDSTLHI